MFRHIHIGQPGEIDTIDSSEEARRADVVERNRTPLIEAREEQPHLVLLLVDVRRRLRDVDERFGRTIG